MFLPQDEVHLWRVDLTRDPLEAAVCLSPEELARAARFAWPHLSRRFCAWRAARRHLLARYLGADPGALLFCVNAYGKPAVAGQPDFFFNGSHSGDLGLLAVAVGQEIGVDIEAVRPSNDLPDLARRFFAPDEAAALLALSPPGQIPAFFAAWTRKEAVIKALGCGLHLPLDQFSVSLRPDEPAGVTRLPAGDQSQWHLIAFAPAKGYAGALAIRGLCPTVVFQP